MDLSKHHSRIETWFPWLLSLLVGLIYAFTLAPSVVEIDSGELAAVQFTGGIAHPTGYPLFTFLGWIFSHIPLGMSKIRQLNFLALIYTTGGIYIFSRSMLFWLGHWAIKKKPQKGEKVQNQQDGSWPLLMNVFSVFTGAFFLAFGKTFWMQSTSVEVYSLHILLINLVLYFALRVWYAPAKEVKPWLGLGIATGLAFANHLTTMMILPGLAVLLLWRLFRSKNRPWKSFLIMLGAGAGVIVLAYAGLMVRANTEPILNWGNPVDFERLLRHTTGAQFQIWFAESGEATKANWGKFMSQLTGDVFFFGSEKTLGFLFSAIGIALGVAVFLFPDRKFRKKRLPLFLFWVITAIFTVFWASLYNINDLESYFLLTYIMMGWAMVGVWKWLTDFLKAQKALIYGLIGLSLLFVGLQIGMHWKKVDKSEVYAYSDYTQTLLDHLPENAMVFSYQWDHFISPSYYFQFVEEKRQDVAIVDTEMLTNRRWYFPQLERCYPGLFDGLDREVEAFRSELLIFDRGGNFNPTVLQQNLELIFTGLIKNQYPKRTAFIAPEVMDGSILRGSLKVPAGFNIVPDHFFYKVVEGNEYVPLAPLQAEIRLPERPLDPDAQDLRIEYIRGVRPRLLRDRALYELGYGKREEARKLVRQLKNDYSWYPIPPQLQTLNL